MWAVTVLSPQSIAFFATSSAATVAANGVLLRDPLKPFAPALAHARVFPSGSVIVMIVLLKVAWMWATPTGTFRRTFRFPFFFGVAIVPPAPYFFVASFFFATAPFRGPFRVLALVWVRC